MDGLQEQHEGILGNEDQDSSYPNSEADSSVFYSPMNSNNPTREASMESEYHSPQEEEGTEDDKARSAENHERLDVTLTAEAGHNLDILALPGNNAELPSSFDTTQQSGQHFRKRMRTFSEPQPRPRKRRPRLLREMERIESSMNPSNPFQDTSDSELDEIESELELEQEYLKQKKKEMKPNLKMPQDGDVCYYCGALTPYEMRRTTPYPTVYQCTVCQQSQPSASPEELQRHEEEFRELEGNVWLNNNGWFADKPRPYEGKILSITQEEYIKNAKATQILPPEQEVLWERNVESLTEDPMAWKMRGLSRKEQFAKYWSRGRSLIAGGMAWTMEEGDLFFQGLRRFGKHNVWAIQEHIKSRSLAEVVTMIQAMEMEVERRKFFCLDTVRLSKMPMAEEADERQIEVEERCATMLIDREMRKTWQEYTTTPRETRPEIVKKTAVFNLRALNDLSRRIYIQNEGAGMDRDVAVEMYGALKKWLTPVIKELAMLHHERHRVRLVLNKSSPPADIAPITPMDVLRTLCAQEKRLHTYPFFANFSKRVRYFFMDDNPIRMAEESDGLEPAAPTFVMDGVGKQYYLNKEVDLADAMAPDSDQDRETDDGVSEEEEAEATLEAPTGIYHGTQSLFQVDKSDLPGPQDVVETNALTRRHQEQDLTTQQWDSFWSTAAQQAREGYKKWMGSSTSMIPTRRRRYRADHPPTPTSMSFGKWQEGAERLAANSHALPIDLPSTAAALSEDDSARIQSMNKIKRSHEQRVYFRHQGAHGHVGFGAYQKKLYRIVNYEHEMATKAKEAYSKQLMETYAPGYGILPKNTSIMNDITRPPPKSGYGLGERDRGGLWLMDKTPLDILGGSGYITVTDTEDEEEEERGWKRQMIADYRIERELKRLKRQAEQQ